VRPILSSTIAALPSLGIPQYWRIRAPLDTDRIFRKDEGLLVSSRRLASKQGVSRGIEVNVFTYHKGGLE
jgi:hypothetical protein